MSDTPRVSFDLKENYLLVTGHGKRDSLAAMAEAAAEIYAKVLETKSSRLLVDYRKLEINIHLNEAFNIVKRYEVVHPALKNLLIAGVFEGKGLAFGKYWSEVSKQRGFHIEIFEDIKVAEKWLLNQ